MKKIFILIALLCGVKVLNASYIEFDFPRAEKEASQKNDKSEDLYSLCKKFQIEFDNYKAERHALEKFYNIGGEERESAY